MGTLGDNPIQVLADYRRLYEEHWAVAQSTRSLAPNTDQRDTYEQARVLRGEIARLFPHVERHLRAVGIDVAGVSGGVRPAAVDRVIALAIERHRERQGLEPASARAEHRSAPRSRRPTVALLTSLVLLSAGGIGWGLLVAGWL